MGKKYIIELEDKPVCVFDEDTQTFFPRLHRVKGFNSLVFDQNGLDKLTPYTEPDLEQVRKEAYDKGYDDATAEIGSDEQAIAEKAYQKGLTDAWEAARKIGSNSMCSLEEMGFDFSQCVVNDYNPSWFVVKNYSASECIEKLRQYEQKQEEIQVGDEVKCIKADWTAIVTKIKEGYLTLMGNDGAIANGYDKKDFIKTGRHFPEIAEVLRKMKEKS